MLVAGVLLVVVLWALAIGALWVYAWFQLGGLDLRATDDDVVALGSVGAQAPEGATTVLVAMTGSRDPTIPGEPELVAPVALVQVGPTREAPAVLLLPTDLPVSVEGLGRVDLDEVHAEGGEDLLARAVIDYAEVRIDHVVSLTEDAFPQMVELLGDVELCTPTGCTPASTQQIRAAQRSDDAETYVRTMTDVLRGVGRSMDRASVIRSPLTAKRAIDIVSDEVRTDVSLRGRTLLHLAHGFAEISAVEHDEVPLLRNPRSGELVPLEEPAMVRFQRLRDGSSLAVEDEDEGLDDLVIDMVDVAVLNGAGIDGLAGAIQVRLETAGFHVVGTGNAASFDRTTTVVAYGPEPETTEAAAVILAERLGDGVQLEPLDRAPTFEGEPVDVLVTVGSDLDPEGGSDG
jgi:anionic cell wall polymer biosynthesis LytR-Cps2A-Psr (LCP) family protein